MSCVCVLCCLVAWDARGWRWRSGTGLVIPSVIVFLLLCRAPSPQHTEGFGWKLSSTFLGGFAFALTVEAVVRRLHAAATAGASTPQSGVHLGHTTCSHYAHGHSGTSHGVQAHGVLVSVRAVDGDVEMDKVAAIPGASAEDSGRQPSQSPYDSES